MGQTLSEPVTEKHTTVVVRGKRYWVGLSDMQGWRISMEDSHTVHLHLPPPDAEASSAPEDKDSALSTASNDIPVQPAGSTVSSDNQEKMGNALFGVFDGHGGSVVAKFTGSTLHTRLQGLESYKKGEYEVALKEGFLKTDEDLRADPNFFNDPSGCTAVVGLVTTDGRFIVANSGDSRCVLGHRGEAKAMSNDHKPTNKEETDRIRAAGGFVEYGRVNGNLALSRAIGDFEFKQNFSLGPEKQIVTADPEIISHKLDGEEEFVVLACDGIWDCLSSQQVVDFTRRAVANGDDLGKIAEDMMTKCLARDSDTGGIGCDNMTVVIVALLGGRTPEEWQAWVKERVDNKVGYDTPESVPDVFQNSPAAASMGGLGGAGFRVSGAGGLANIASILGASGITFKAPEDDSDEEEGEAKLQDMPDKLSPEASPALAKVAHGAYMDDQALSGKTAPKDVTDDLEEEEHQLDRPAKSASVRLVDDDGDSTMDSGDESDATTTGDAANTSAPTGSSSTPSRSVPNAGQKGSPAAPSFTSIGSPEVPTHAELLRTAKATDDTSPQQQLRKTPEGDQASAAVQAEGLMDVSEGPLKM